MKGKRSVLTTRLHNQCSHLLSAPRAVLHIVRVETDVEVNVLELHDGAAGNVLKPWRKKGKAFIRSEPWKKWLAASLPAHSAKWMKSANNRSLHKNDTRRPFPIEIH